MCSCPSEEVAKSVQEKLETLGFHRPNYFTIWPLTPEVNSPEEILPTTYIQLERKSPKECFTISFESTGFVIASTPTPLSYQYENDKKEGASPIIEINGPKEEALAKARSIEELEGLAKKPFELV